MRRRPGVRLRPSWSAGRAEWTFRWCDEGLCSAPLPLAAAALPAPPHDLHRTVLAALVAADPPASPEALCRATRWADMAVSAIRARRGKEGEQ